MSSVRHQDTRGKRDGSLSARADLKQPAECPPDGTAPIGVAAQARNRWIVRIAPEFLDSVRNPWPRFLKIALITVEGFAQRRWFAWPHIDELAARHGCQRRQMYSLLRELVSLDKLLIAPYLVGKYAGNIYILRDRADRDFGVFDPANPDCCVACTRDEVHFIKSGRPSLFIKNCAHSTAQKCGLEHTDLCSPLHKKRRPHPLQRIEEQELNKRTETTTTSQGEFWEPHTCEAPAESSSSLSLDRPEREPSITQAVVAPTAADPELTELVDQAAKILTGERLAELPGKVRAQLRAGIPAWWIRDALVAAERMAPRDGRKRHWGMVLGVLKRFPLEDKPPVEPAARAAPIQASSDDDKIQSDCDKALTAELEARWNRLTEAERDSIIASVNAENPTLVRWPKLIRPHYLAAAADRRPAP